MNEGGRLKSNLTGKFYKVKMVKGQLVVLESEDGSSQVLTEKENLKLFYEQVKNESREKDFPKNSWFTLSMQMQTKITGITITNAHAYEQAGGG